MCQASSIPTTSEKPTEATSEDKIVKFASCGLDRSCPTSVTTHQGQGVRLDQYQSCIREKRDKRRSQNIFEGSGLADQSTQSSFNNFDPSTFSDNPITTDHEFEWYDLDAIRELDSAKSNDDCPIIISHDFNAGLIFTTERQILTKGMEANVVSKTANKNGQEFEFDLFFWVNGETPSDREFRERMEEVEQEINSGSSSLPSSLIHLAVSLSSSSSNHEETKKDDDSDGSGNFFASWLFEDTKNQ